MVEGKDEGRGLGVKISTITGQIFRLSVVSGERKWE